MVRDAQCPVATPTQRQFHCAGSFLTESCVPPVRGWSAPTERILFSAEPDNLFKTRHLHIGPRGIVGRDSMHRMIASHDADEHVSHGCRSVVLSPTTHPTNLEARPKKDGIS